MFGKSKLLKVSWSAEQKNPNIEQANEVVYNLDYFDIDKPYLDELEQKVPEESELDLNDE